MKNSLDHNKVLFALQFILAFYSRGAHLRTPSSVTEKLILVKTVRNVAEDVLGRPTRGLRHSVAAVWNSVPHSVDIFNVSLGHSYLIL